MAFRPYYLAKYWSRRGVRTHIVGASYSHLRSRQPQVNSLVHRETIDQISYFWIKTPKYLGNGLGRVINIVCFLAGILINSRRMLRETLPNIIIASSTYPMDVFVGWYLAKVSGAKLVFELHDVWPESLIELAGLHPYHPFVLLVGLSERAAYKLPHLFISMLPSVSAHCVSRGLAPDKLVIVPNGFDNTQSDSKSGDLPQGLQSFLSMCRKKERFVIGYAGAHGLPNNLETLIDAAASLPMHFTIALVGDGQEKSTLMAKAKSLDLTNVEFFEPIPKDAMPTFLQYCDVAYIGAKKSKLYRHGVSPNKLMDYMMAEVPILFAIEAGNNPVEEAGCGISIKAEDSDEVVRGIKHLSNLCIEERRDMGRRGKQYALLNYSYDILSDKFLSAMRSISS